MAATDFDVTSGSFLFENENMEKWVETLFFKGAAASERILRFLPRFTHQKIFFCCGMEKRQSQSISPAPYCSLTGIILPSLFKTCFSDRPPIFCLRL